MNYEFVTQNQNSLAISHGDYHTFSKQFEDMSKYEFQFPVGDISNSKILSSLVSDFISSCFLLQSGISTEKSTKLSYFLSGILFQLTKNAANFSLSPDSPISYRIEKNQNFIRTTVSNQTNQKSFEQFNSYCKSLFQASNPESFQNELNESMPLNASGKFIGQGLVNLLIHYPISLGVLLTSNNEQFFVSVRVILDLNKVWT